MEEARLGLLNGVLSTRPGFLAGDEVVEVVFDPKRLSFEKLTRLALKAECVRKVFTRSDAQHQQAGSIAGDRAVRNSDPIQVSLKDLKYYLSRTELRFLPMTRLQAERLNGSLKSPDHLDLLSPGQRELLKTIRKHPEADWQNVLGKDLIPAWQAAREVLENL